MLRSNINFKSQKGDIKIVWLLKGAFIFRNDVLEATGPRDAVFTRLGISADAADLHIALDYSKSKAQAFTDVAIGLFGQIGIEVLTWCNFILPSGETPLTVAVRPQGHFANSKKVPTFDIWLLETAPLNFNFSIQATSFRLFTSQEFKWIAFSWLDKRYLSQEFNIC